MVKRKKKSASVHTHLSIELLDFSACVDASVNYEVRDSRKYHDDAKVFKFESYIEVKGIYAYPKERIDEKVRLTIYGSDSSHRDFDLTLADCHVRDDYGSPKYRKVRGKEVAIYNIPQGIGTLERQRGTTNWSGIVWVNKRTVTDMLTLLTNVRPLFIALHECRVDRIRWVVGLTLQTNDPEDE